MTKLPQANIDASAGALEKVIRVVTHIGARRSQTPIVLRADSGFCREALMVVRISIRHLVVVVTSACPWQTEFVLAHASLRRATA